MKPDYDVLVVGAGPAGCATAQRLAAEGHAVALIDENERPRCDIACSGIVSLEAYQRFGLPAEAVVDTIHEVRFLSPSGHEFRYRPARALAHVVDRTVFDGSLADRAERSGAVLLRGRLAIRVRVSPGAVALEVRSGGQPGVLVARALVVATGYRSRLHEEAGLGRPTRFVQGIHHQVQLRNGRDTEVHFGRRVAPGYFAWAVPFGDRTMRVGLLAPRGGRTLLQGFLRSGGIESWAVDPPAAFHGRCNGNGRALCRGIVQGVVDPSAADRVLAVGEAAGQVKTTTGGGLYYGLLGAELAAEILSEALLRDRLSARALAFYHRAWTARLGREIRMGLRLQRLGRMLDDGDTDEVFGLLQGTLGGAMTAAMRFDWHRTALRLLFTSPRLHRLAARRMLARIRR